MAHKNNKFSGFKYSLIASSLALAITSTSAIAQDNTTGIIKGVINSASGSELADVTITVKHKTKGISRTVSSNAEGEYSLRNLPVGQYTVTVSKDGFNTIEQETITVSLGQSVIFEPVLGAGSDIERISVRGSAFKMVDTSDSTAGLTFTQDELDLMPVENGFESIALLTPGVAESSEFDSSSFGGGSSAENSFYLNGLNVTELRRGIGSVDLPWEAISETQVQTGAISAEFGRFIGGVVNAVTKSGDNEFRFGVEARHDPSSLYSPHDTNLYDDGTVNLNREESESEFTEYNFWGSGAIIEDQLFFYALYNPRETNDEWATRTTFTDRKIEQDRWLASIDYYINENHSINITAFNNEEEETRDFRDYDFQTGIGAPSGNTLSKSGGDAQSISYKGILTDDLSVNAVYGQITSEVLSTPTNNLPGAWNCVGQSCTFYGDATDTSINTEDFERTQFRFDVNYETDNHSIKFGVDIENTELEVVEQQNGVGEAQGWWEYRSLDADNSIGLPAGDYVRRRVRVSGGVTEVNTRGIYIQDTWSINDNFTAKLGLRSDTFENTASDGQTYADLSNMISPRLQLIWDPTGDGSSKAFVTLGRYYQPISANMNIRQANGQSDVRTYYEFTGQLDSNGNPVLQSDGSMVRGDVLATHVVQDGSVDVEAIASNDLKGMYSDEITFGYEQEVADRLKASGRVTYRKLGRSIEDTDFGPIVDNWLRENGLDEYTGGYWYIVHNPGETVDFRYDFDGDGTKEHVVMNPDDHQLPDAERQYLSFEANLEGKVTDDLRLYASYVWSHSWGITEGLVRTDNGQADPGWTTSYDYKDLMDHGYGDLPNDHRHAIKLSGIYNITEDLTFGFASRFTSGAPKNRFSVHPSGVDSCAEGSPWSDCASRFYGEASFYDWDGTPAPRGSAGRLGWIKNIDMSLTYVMDVMDNPLTLSAQVYNVFGFDGALSREEIAQSTDADGNFIPNPRYNVITSQQSPRSVSLKVRYEF